jgi:tRNA A-37 threonylcarbamoyl transferase component Bud32
MPTIAAIKAAARKLSVKHRTDLLEDFARDEAVHREQISRLRATVEEGERDFAEGRYIEINSKAELREFFNDIKRRGRARLKRSA